MLIRPPVLAYPNFVLPFVLHTDVSEQGVRAVLYQQQDGKLQVFGYGSRTFGYQPLLVHVNMHRGVVAGCGECSVERK